AKTAVLRDTYGIEWRLTGIASRRIGWMAEPKGLAPAALLENRFPEMPAWRKPQNVRQWLEAADPGVFFEASSLDRRSGQPATDPPKAGPQNGRPALHANK